MTDPMRSARARLGVFTPARDPRGKGTTGRRLRAVIAVRDASTREAMRSLLSDHRDCALVAEARSTNETVRSLRLLQPDILFVDEELAMLDAVQLLRECSLQRLPAVVFVTSRRSSAASDCVWLGRPIDRDAFLSALDRVTQRCRRSAHRPSSHGDDGRAAARPFIVTVARRKLLIQPSEVGWIGAMGYYAVLHTAGRGHLIRESLESLSHRLDPLTFIRVHRSAITNVNAIRAMGPAPNGEMVITLEDGTRIPVSRRRRRAVTALLRRITH